MHERSVALQIKPPFHHVFQSVSKFDIVAPREAIEVPILIYVKCVPHTQI